MVSHSSHILFLAVILMCDSQIRAQTSTSATEGTTYIDKECGYALTAPRGWRQIPQDVIDNFIKKMSTPEAQKNFRVGVGFQKGGDDWLEYPYCLVSLVPYAVQPDEAQAEEMIAAMSGYDVSQILEQDTTEFAKSVYTAPRMNVPSYDRKSHSFAWTVDMDLKGMGSVRGIIFGKFGRYAILQVGMYATAKDFGMYQEEFLAIGKSLGFNEFGAFVPGGDPFVKSSRGTNPWRKATQYAIIGGAVGALSWFFRKKNRTKGSGSK